MPPETELPTPTAEKPPRSVSKAIGALLSGCFWVSWDYFWKLFNLDAVGDEMKEHSSSLNKKRAGVLVVLLLVLLCGVYVESTLNKGQIEGLQDKNKRDTETITDLRNYNAGRPHAESPAELMGLHDQTNYYAVTNTISATNTITRISTLTNSVVYFASHPVLDLFQMERIKEKLDSVPHVPIHILYKENDDAAIALSKQIAQIFMIKNFELRALNPVSFRFPSNGVTVMSKGTVAGITREALNQLFYEIQQPQQYDVESFLPEAPDIYFLVTTTQQ